VQERITKNFFSHFIVLNEKNVVFSQKTHKVHNRYKWRTPIYYIILHETTNVWHENIL